MTATYTRETYTLQGLKVSDILAAQAEILTKLEETYASLEYSAMWSESSDIPFIDGVFCTKISISYEFPPQFSGRTLIDVSKIYDPKDKDTYGVIFQLKESTITNGEHVSLA